MWLRRAVGKNGVEVGTDKGRQQFMALKKNDYLKIPFGLDARCRHMVAICKLSNLVSQLPITPRPPFDTVSPNGFATGSNANAWL